MNILLKTLPFFSPENIMMIMKYQGEY